MFCGENVGQMFFFTSISTAFPPGWGHYLILLPHPPILSIHKCYRPCPISQKGTGDPILAFIKKIQKHGKKLRYYFKIPKVGFQKGLSYYFAGKYN